MKEEESDTKNFKKRKGLTVIQVTLKDLMVNGFIGFSLKDDKMVGRDIFLGQYSLDLRKVL